MMPAPVPPPLDRMHLELLRAETEEVDLDDVPPVERHGVRIAAVLGGMLLGVVILGVLTFFAIAVGGGVWFYTSLGQADAPAVVSTAAAPATDPTATATPAEPIENPTVAVADGAAAGTVEDSVEDPVEDSTDDLAANAAVADADVADDAGHNTGGASAAPAKPAPAVAKTRTARPAPRTIAPPEPEPELAADIGGEDLLLPATVKILSSPPAAVVYIDGAEIGRTPLKTELEPGAHTVRLTTRKADDRTSITVGPEGGKWCFAIKGRKVTEVACS